MEFRYQLGGATRAVHLEREGDHFLAEIDGRKYRVELLQAESGEYVFALDGRILHGYAMRGERRDPLYVALNGATFVLSTPETGKARRAASTGEENLTAPM